MKDWILSRRFFFQILISVLSLLLLLCILFSVILFNNARRSTDASIRLAETDRAQELLRHSTRNWQRIISSTAGFTSLAVGEEQLNTSENIVARTILNAMVRSHVAYNGYTSNIDLIIGNKSTFPSVVPHERHLGSFYFYDIYTTAEPKWPYSIDLQTNYGSQLNNMVITVDAYFLSRELFTFDNLERIDCLLLPDGTILLSNHYSILFQNIQDLMPGLSLEEPDPETNTLPTYNDYYFLLTENDNLGFRILSLCPKSIYSAQFSTATHHAMLMSVCLLLLAVLISLFLAFFFYQPVKKTMDLVLTYVPQELHDYENEIQFIHQNIRKYVGAAKNSPDLPGTFSKLQSAQTAVLQHQINSHFLFNTLENIKAISVTELGPDNEIENSIILLNSIIHEGVFQKNLLVPLSHELHLAKCYLELMQIRFPDVDVFWSVDESLLQCQVFKFSLQPILENCFAHAFKGNLHRQKAIYLQVQQQGDDLSIHISDNGLGIDPEAFQKLSQTLEAPDKIDEPKHVGVRNIHQRITDTFGQNYGIRITNISPGLAVDVRYPLLRERIS